MADYKLYCVDGAGKIAAAAEAIEARNDDEAVVLVRARKLSVACELWHRDRLVARIAAHKKAR